MHQKRIGIQTTSSSAPPPWQAGMQVRGGRVVRTLARAGGTVFAVLGSLLMFVVIVRTTTMLTGDAWALLGAFFGWLFIFGPVSAALCGILGLGVKMGARAWLRSASPAAAAVEERTSALAGWGNEVSVRLGTRWAEHYARCVRSVVAYHDIVGGLPQGAAKSWLVEVGQNLDAHLGEALRLAELGDSVENSSGPDSGMGAAGARAEAQLRAAAVSFEQTTARAGEIALDLQEASDFTRVQAQLDVLAEQTARFRVTDSP